MTKKTKCIIYDGFMMMTMTMTMTPDVNEKKWRHHDDLAVTVNDAAPWSGAVGGGGWVEFASVYQMALLMPPVKNSPF